MSFERRIASLQYRLAAVMQSVGQSNSTPLSFCKLPNGQKIGIQCHFGTNGARLGFQMIGAYNQGDSLQNFTSMLHNGILENGSWGGGEMPICDRNYESTCSVQVANGGTLTMFVLGTKGRPCRIGFAINGRSFYMEDESIENARDCIVYCRRAGFLAE